jgi:hypothetical protein
VAASALEAEEGQFFYAESEVAGGRISTTDDSPIQKAL